MDLWTAFILGLAGSLHCAGMCGPLALALPHPPGGQMSFLAGRAVYNLGRVVTYCLLGLVFGAVGKSLWLAGMQRWLSIALGILLLAGLFASRKVALSPPVTGLVCRLKTGMLAVLRKRSIAALWLFGLLNGLLPCGLVYVACAGATATGGVLAGAQYMAAFGLGTVPLMLGIGLSRRLIPPPLRLKLLRVVPASVFLLALLLVLRGMSLNIPYLSPDLSTPGCCHK